MSLADYSLHTCEDHSHSHLTKDEVYELQSHGAIEWLRGSISSTAKDKGVFKIRRFFPYRGLSCSVGGTLAEMLGSSADRMIASVMLAHINQRSEGQRAES